MFERTSAFCLAIAMTFAASACTAETGQPDESSTDPLSLRPAPPVAHPVTTDTYDCEYSFPYRVTFAADGTSATITYKWAVLGGPYVLPASTTPAGIMVAVNPETTTIYSLDALSAAPTISVTMSVTGEGSVMSTCTYVIADR